MNVTVVEGDIAQVKSDAIIAAINSNQVWIGAIDNVIIRAAGMQFHDQARKELTLRPETAKVFAATRQEDHKGLFGDVVFVVDDLKDPLDLVISMALNHAAEQGYRSVTLPAIRFGVFKHVGDSAAQKIQHIADAIRAHSGHVNALESITIVVYDDRGLANWLRSAL